MQKITLIRIGLIAASLLPLPLGYLIDHLMHNQWFYEVPWLVLRLIGAGLFVYWFALGLFAMRFLRNVRHSLIFINAIPAVMLSLTLLWVVLIEQNWFTQPSAISEFYHQLYYLPFMNLIVNLPLLRSFATSYSTIVIVTFALLLILSYGGVKLATRISRR